MKFLGSKVVIIGAGMVGSATAFSLSLQGVCSEILLVDLNKEKALGEVLDLQHSIEYQSRNVRISVGDYEDCKDANVVIITASVPMSGIKNRLDMLHKNIPVINAIVDGIMESGFNGHIIVVSNPVDVLSYHVYKRSGLPKAQVIGTGTALETARLKQIIGHMMRIDPRSVQAYSMGEHGDAQMVPWSHVRVAGKGFQEVMEDNPHRFENMDLEQLVRKTGEAGFEVLKRKGSTQFGIASAVTGIVSSILRDENRMITVSTLLEGEYGERDVFCGVPAILGKEGVIEIGEFRLNSEEKEKFHHAACVIRASIRTIESN
jgi:L-lactate dehydrogenase